MAVGDDKGVETLNQQTRSSLNDAYAFLVGQQNVDTFAAFTPEDAYDLQIERIEGEDTDARPNELHRVNRIENDLLATIERIKSLPDSAFLDPDSTTDVNTPAKDDDE